MTIARIFIPTISSIYQLQQQLNAALTNIYDALDNVNDVVPLTTGAEPPVLMSNGAGGLIFVAYTP